MADRMASSANMEQCSLTGGRLYRRRESRWRSRSYLSILTGDGPSQIDSDSPEFLCDLGILDQPGIIQGQPPDPLGHVTTTGDSTSTSKGLELYVLDDSVVVDLDLKLHHVSAGGSTDESSTDVRIVLVHRTDLQGIKESESLLVGM